MPPALTLLAAIVGLLLAGCDGGAVHAHALSIEASSVQSLAAEGGLLAQDAASGRATHTFTSEHASELQKAASKVAASLAMASTTPALTPTLRRLSVLAVRVRADLGRLGAAEPVELRAIGRRLRSAAGSSGDIAKALE